MRTILIIVLGLFIAQNLKAQNDSLIIKLEDYGQMVVVSSNLTTVKQGNIGLNDKYKKFYEENKKIFIIFGSFYPIFSFPRLSLAWILGSNDIGSYFIKTKSI